MAVLALAAALLQSLGRLGAWLLDDFEGALNGYLGDGITISGLRGGWQGFNPVVRAARINLPAGSMEQVLIELDWPETLLRSRWIMQRLFVERATLEVVHKSGEWALAGPGREVQGFDWLGLLNYTDEIRFNGRISVAGDPDSALQVEVLGFNRDGFHGFDIQAAGARCSDGGDCVARLQWRRWPHRWSLPPAQRYLSLEGELGLPFAYLGLPNRGHALAIGVQGRWTTRDAVGGGEFTLGIKPVGDHDDGEGVTSLKAGLQIATQEGIHHAIAAKTQLESGELTLDLRPVHVRGSGGQVHAWIDELPLEELGRFLRSVLPQDSAVSGWITGADARGTLRNVHLAYDAEGFAYGASFDGLQTEAHRGLPMLRDASGSLLGHPSGLLATLNSESMRVHLADTFDSPWQLANLQGRLQGWFGEGYFGLRSPWFRVDLPDGRMAGTLALSRPPGYFDQRLSLLLNMDRLSIPADPYIPHTLPEDLQRWLHEGPRKGQFAGLKLAYQGQVHTRPDDYSRRAAIRAQLSGGEVRFQSDWPVVSQAQGFVEVSGESVFAELESAASMGLEVWRKPLAPRPQWRVRRAGLAGANLARRGLRLHSRLAARPMDGLRGGGLGRGG